MSRARYQPNSVDGDELQHWRFPYLVIGSAHPHSPLGDGFKENPGFNPRKHNLCFINYIMENSIVLLN